MSKESEKEILRLVREIADDEASIVDAERESRRTYLSDSEKQMYKDKAESLTRSVARKLEVLKILREA